MENEIKEIIGNKAVIILAKKWRIDAVIQIRKRYEGKILEECPLRTKCRYNFVTNDEFVIQNNQSSFIVYKLSNIAYVRSFRDIATRQWTFAIWDKDKKQKGLDGQLVAGTREPKKFKSSSLMMMPQVDADKLCEFIVEHAPHVQILNK